MDDARASWVVISAVAGVLGALLTLVGYGVVQRRKPTAKFSEWMARVELLSNERVRLALAVADVETQLAEMLGKLPKDFDGPVFAAARLGHAVERGALDEAVRLKLVRPEEAEAIRRGCYAAVAEPLSSPAAASLAPPPDPSPTIPPPPPVPGSSRVLPFLLRRR